MMKPRYEITQKILDLHEQITEALGRCESFLNLLDIAHRAAVVNRALVACLKKDILEVKNANSAYDQLSEYDPLSIKDFQKAHGVFMNRIIEFPGQFRERQVGIRSGKKITLITPGFDRVPTLVKALFGYLSEDADLKIIKSCVFHYEVSVIHPFEDGNGRIARFWQTRLLMVEHPIFEYVPIEESIKNRWALPVPYTQKEYLNALSQSDSARSSTIFIEFMLQIIHESLRKVIKESKISTDN